MNGKRYVLVNTLTMECYYSKTFKALANAAKLSRRQVKYMYDKTVCLRIPLGVLHSADGGVPRETKVDIANPTPL